MRFCLVREPDSTESTAIKHGRKPWERTLTLSFHPNHGVLYAKCLGRWRPWYATFLAVERVVPWDVIEFRINEAVKTPSPEGRSRVLKYQRSMKRRYKGTSIDITGQKYSSVVLDTCRKTEYEAISYVIV